MAADCWRSQTAEGVERVSTPYYITDERGNNGEKDME